MAAPKGMPEFAKGTKQAQAYSNINKYDVVKADRNAENASQKEAVFKQVVKQSNQPVKKEFNLPSNGLFRKAVDVSGALFGKQPVSGGGTSTAKKVDLNMPQGAPIYASGNADAIKNYTASNVAPMTEEEKRKAFLQSVDTRMGIEKDLMGSRFVPPSQTTLQNKALQFVNTNLQNAQDRTAVPQVSSNVVAPNGSNMFNYPSQQPPQASATSEALKKLITSGGDGGGVGTVTNKGTVPMSDEEYAKQYNMSGAFRNANLGQPPVTPVKSADESVTPDWLVDRGKTYVTKEEDEAAKAKGAEEERLRKEKEAADAIAAKLKAEAGAGESTPPEVVPPPLKDIPTADQPVDTGPTAEEYQKAAEDSAYAEASRQVNDQIAAQNAEYDAQINLALNNRDYQTAQALEAQRQSTEQMVKNQFIQAQQIEQNMANRGILNSGIATDVQARLQMSMNDNIRGLETKRMETAQKLAGDFQIRLDDINSKRQKLESGRAGDVAKLANGILKDVDALNKANLDLRKLQIDENKILMANAKSSLDRLAKQGYNTAPFEALATSGDTEALARAMAQSGEPSLSLLGKDMSQQIEKTKADILLTQRKASKEIADIDKTYSNLTGQVFVNGILQKDKKGNPIMTQDAREFVKEFDMKSQKMKNDQAVKSEARAIKSLMDSQKLDLARRRIDDAFVLADARMQQNAQLAENRITSAEDRAVFNSTVKFRQNVYSSAVEKQKEAVASGKKLSQATIEELQQAIDVSKDILEETIAKGMTAKAPVVQGPPAPVRR